MRMPAALLFTVLAVAPLGAAPASYTLSANAPAKLWDEGYGVGNGRLGAIAYGVWPRTTVVLNESSIYSAVEVARRPTAKESLRKARELCRAGKLHEADELMRTEVIGVATASGSYRPAALLAVEHLDAQPPASVRRELDMGAGVATERFEWVSGKSKYAVRGETVAAAEPYDVVAVRYTADRPMRVAFALETPVVGANDKRIFGTPPPVVLLHRVRDNELVYSANAGGKGGTLYETRVRIVPGPGGSLEEKDGRLVVSGAREILVLAATTTDFDILQPGVPSTRVRSEVNLARLDDAVHSGWGRLRESSAARFRDAMNRCAVDVGDSAPEVLKLTTPERLARVQTGGADPDLFEQMFQFGRYCTVACARPGALPPGLQGLWNPTPEPPWFGSYTININAQMNQWPAETTGLGEFHKPFVDFVRGGQPGGEAFARDIGYAGLCFGHAVDVRRGSWFGRNMTWWGASVMNGAWLGSHLVDRYRFSGDREDLRKSLPYLRESARFVLGWFEPEAATGAYLSGPGASPENAFWVHTPAGRKQAAVSLGCGYDQSLGRQALRDYLTACRELGVTKDELYARAAERLPKTPPPPVDADGRVREWRDALPESEPGHRHVSHLIGLFPGDDFNFADTPAHVAAVRKSLDARLAHDGGGTGWSAAWMANLYANTHDGDKAHALLTRILAKFTGVNFFNQHPPFQIDGNFGFTSAVAECLVQSRHEESGRRVVTLLPALPSAWPAGTAEGLRARGGLVVNLTWTPEGVTAELTALRDGRFRIRYLDALKDIDIASGESVTLEF